MKISEMTNDQAAEALIRLAVPFGNICDDEKMVEMMEKYSKAQKNIPAVRAIGQMLPDAVAYAFKEHKDDLYEIVGTLTFKNKAQVAQMKFFDTIKVLKDSYDEVLQSFFTSSVKQIKKTVEESSQG